MRIMFFFGAGASSGSVDCTFDGRNTTFTTPPLGANLYMALCQYSQEFAEKTKSFSSEFNIHFERGMAAIAHTGLAPYLHKLTAQYLHLFHPGPRNLYGKLLR